MKPFNSLVFSELAAPLCCEEETGKDFSELINAFKSWQVSSNGVSDHLRLTIGSQENSSHNLGTWSVLVIVHVNQRWKVMK